MSSDLVNSLGPYQVSGRLGSGGMGEVFLAYDPRLDRQVAIKRILPDSVLEAEHRSRLQREAKLAAGLLHPAIVQIFDLLTLEDIDHIVMEFVPGNSLRQALKAGPLPLPEGLRVARAVASGLAYAHRKGVIHRDLKTENVLLTPDGDAKIADFGIARRLPTMGQPTDEPLTRVGAVMGTYRSMSPEQACGDPLDARSDLFSLGVLLYETFTGQSPFLADSNARTIERVFKHHPPPAGKQAGVPPSLSGLIDHLLEKEPHLRPREAQEVTERLDAVSESVRLESEDTLTADAIGPVMPMPTRQEVTRTIRTLMLTDLVRSTDLVTRLGDRRAMELNGRHDDMARALVEDHGGLEIDKSDGFLLLFERPIEAVHCAVDYHTALEELSEQEGVELSARAGIHLGEIFLRENSPQAVHRGAKPLEVEGLAKAIVARVTNLAGAGQTLITRGAFELAQRAATDDNTDERPLRWMSHGLYRFQGVEDPMEVCQVGIERRSPLRPPTAGGKVRRVGSSRSRRRAWIALAIVTVIAIVVALAVKLRPPSSPLYVAVLKPEVQSVPSAAPRDEAFLTFAIRNAQLRALAGLEHITPTTFHEVDSASGSPVEVARAVGADELVASTITCTTTKCDVDLSRILADGGRLIEHRQVPISISETKLSAQAVMIGLRQLFPDRRARAGMGRFEVDSGDYATYLDIQRQLDMGEGALSIADSLERLEAIRRSSHSFVDAYLLEAYIATNGFTESGDSALLDHALRLLDQAQVIAPGDPDVLFRRVYVENVGAQFDQAELTLEALEQLVPADVRILDVQASILLHRGEASRALEFYHMAKERKISWRRLYNYARCAYGLGKIAAARSSLEQLLTRSPKNYRGQSLLARLELTAGEPTRAIELYHGLPKLAAIQLSNLGLAHMLLGHYDEAVSALERAVATAPTNPSFLLNLADVRKLQGWHAEAQSHYLKVVQLIDEQPSSTRVQYLQVRAQALAHLGKKHEAVKAIRETLSDAQEHGGSAFEASLVFAIVGDHTTALVYAEQAINLGYRHLNWFNLPWFSELRANADFAQIILRDSNRL